MTPRLTAIADAIEPCGTLCDVGCDHGYVSYLAFLRGVCEKLVITDVSAPSLQKAERLLSGSGIPFVSYCTDGMDGVTQQIDCAVIGGMGGYEILSVLERKKPERLVLQPMRDVPAVRRYLTENGYEIRRDFVVKSEGKFYDILTARKGVGSLTELQTFFGRGFEEKTPDFCEYLERCKQKNRRIAERASGVRRETAQRLLRLIEEAEYGKGI